MIRYALRCDRDHGFESWFQSADAFERLLAASMVSCAVCGSTRVEKTLMTPALVGGQPGRDADDAAGHPLSQPQSPVEQALAALRRQVEANSEYVGLNFVTEARAMHQGDAPERAIHGEARADEARRLIEDGIPVAPLPFMPPRKTN